MCPLCGLRKARRACPALGHQICPVCCGTKRLTEIQCPAGCVYLQSAREHPAAAVVRQQQHDLSILVDGMRDLSRTQSDLFLVLATFLTQYQPHELQPLLDEDVTEAVASLAATFETSARGLIYEHRPASIPAERLASAIKPLLAEAGGNGGSAFDRDAAFVLRKLGAAVDRARTLEPSNRRAFLDILRRTIRKHGDDQTPATEPAGQPSRLILP